VIKVQSAYFSQLTAASEKSLDFRAKREWTSAASKSLEADYCKGVRLLRRCTDGFDGLFDFADSLSSNLSNLETALSGDTNIGGGDASGNDGANDAQ
jgi:hypothetical protein